MKTNIDFKNKKIAIIGAGVEGMSSAQYLASKGADVTILDQRDEKEIGKLGNLAIKIRGGEQYLDGLDKYHIIVRSPGIKRDIPELKKAEEKGAIVTSQTKLFFEFCPCPIIGITGTKGKGTTSSLIYEMVKKDKKDAYLGGNIGKPPFEFLDTLTPQSLVVLELSSYQLQDLTRSPHIAIMLMITSEHLSPDKKDTPHQNYHGDIYEYVDAKRNLLRFQTPQDFAILNRDYPAANESDIYTDGAVFLVSREREVPEQGCFVRGQAIWVQRFGNEQKIIDTKDILLPGRHNLENVCAAVMAAILAGVSKESIVSVLKMFKGLEHRLELVASVNGVRYFDDSFSTTPETAIAAIQAFKESEVLILGGAHKGSDFSELGSVIGQANNIRGIIGIGLEWGLIKEEIQNYKKELFMIEGAQDMHQIVQAASKIAQPGDVVLLSPACSSFDMFKNYKERGELFKQEVKKLKK